MLHGMLLSPSSALSLPEDSPRVSDDRAPLIDGAEQSESKPQKRAAWRSWMAMLTLAVLSASIITIAVMHWRSHPSPTPLRMQALILGSNPARFESSASVVRQAFPSLALSISSVPMVPLTDPRVEYRRKVDAWTALPKRKRPSDPSEQILPPLQSTAKLREQSTFLGWMDMFARTAAEPALDDDDWILMFEDDVALVPQPAEAGSQPFDYTPALLELLALPAVQDDGIVYLGACGPQWAPLDPAVRQSERNRFNSTSAPHWLSSRRAVAFCTHAMAFTKRRARTLPSDLATLLHTSLTNAIDVNLRLLSFATHRWPFVLGAERRSPQSRDHFGLFFQDRKHHKSIINVPGDRVGESTKTKGATAKHQANLSTRPRNSVAPIGPRQPAQMQAWILTSKPERFRSSVAAIERAFPQLLNITAIAPVPLSDTRIEYRRRSDAWEALPSKERRRVPDMWHFDLPPLSSENAATKRLFSLSAYFSWTDAWARAASDPALADDDWILMFEDDVALVPQPPEAGPQPFDYTHALLELLALPAAQSDGIVYLGACGPDWAPRPLRSSAAPLSDWSVLPSRCAPAWLSSRRGIGSCQHAMAFTKRRLRTLHTDISAYLERDHTFFLDFDLRLFCRATGQWPFIFGDTRRSPQTLGHVGIFFQDRATHRSIIDGAKGGNLDKPANTASSEHKHKQRQQTTHKQMQLQEVIAAALVEAQL